MKLWSWYKEHRETSRQRRWWKAQERQRKAHLKAYNKRHSSALKPISLKRHRPLSLLIDEPSCESPRKAMSSPESRLLSLPAEIRTLVWELAVAGQYIGLYRDKGNLKYGLLDDSNTQAPSHLVPLSAQTVRSEVARLVKVPGDHSWEHPPRAPQRKITALLRTCRLIYSEMIDVLYSGNTFVCLQNHALEDLRTTILPCRFAKIRSLHLHWQLREIAYTRDRHLAFPPPWDLYTFFQINIDVLQVMLQLDRLSIFFQGPLLLASSYQKLLVALWGTAPVVPPKSFAVRFPWPTHEVYMQGWDQLGPINEALENPDLPFRVDRAPLLTGHEPRDMADEDPGDDTGWRVGVIFSPSSDGAGDYVTTSYAVYTPF